MIGSTEQINDEIEDLRRQDFDEYVEEIGQDGERELDREDTLSPVLQSMCNDLWISIIAQCARRTYQPVREWL